MTQIDIQEQEKFIADKSKKMDIPDVKFTAEKCNTDKNIAGDNIFIGVNYETDMVYS